MVEHRARSPLNENEINANYVFDMVYDPAETRFLKAAEDRGAQIIPGIEMFVQSGCAAIRDLDRQARALGRHAASRHRLRCRARQQRAAAKAAAKK